MSAPGGDFAEITVGQLATPARPDIAAAHRAVVKIGSSSLTTRDGAIDDARIAALAGAIAARVRDGRQVLLVSSGAIAAGLVTAWPEEAPQGPGHPAGRRERGPGPADRALHRGVRRTASASARCC